MSKKNKDSEDTKDKSINMKTASSLLAMAQGGLVVRGVLTRTMVRSEVEAIFGKDKIPAYTVTECFKISLKPLDNGDYQVSLSRTK